MQNNLKMPVVLLELVGVPGTKEYVAVVTLNRPQAKNALNKELSLELASTLGDLRSRDDIRVCIIIGSGQCFCAGEVCAVECQSCDCCTWWHSCFHYSVLQTCLQL